MRRVTTALRSAVTRARRNGSTELAFGTPGARQTGVMPASTQQLPRDGHLCAVCVIVPFSIGMDACPAQSGRAMIERPCPAQSGRAMIERRLSPGAAALMTQISLCKGAGTGQNRPDETAEDDIGTSLLSSSQFGGKSR